MNQVIETLNIKGFDVEISYDQSAENPRMWADYTSKICTAHRRYSIGDIELSHDANSLIEAFDLHLEENGLTREDIIYLPIYLYDHGCITISPTPFSCRWDSGQIGFIYELSSEFSKHSIPLIKELLECEIAELDLFLKGEVYQFYIPALEESLSGFYGSDHSASGLMDEVECMIDNHVRSKRCQHFERLKKLIKSKVAIQYRPTCPI